MTVSTLGERIRSVESSDFRISVVSYTAGARLDDHDHLNPVLSAILAGQMTETVGEQTHRGETGDLVFKPARTNHQNHVGPWGARILSIEIDRNAFLRMATEAEAFPAWHWRSGHGLSRSVLPLAIDIQTSGRNLEQRVRKVVRSFLSTLGETLLFDFTRTTPRWLGEVRNLIDASPKSSVRTGDLAEFVGVHRVYLARAFRKHFGKSISAYRMNRRTDTAAALLLASQQPLAQIAVSSGFYDQSHMTRAFVSMLGLTPGQLRRAIQH